MARTKGDFVLPFAVVILLFDQRYSVSLFPCHSLCVTLQPFLQPFCLVGIAPDLVLASQTPYSKLLKFQNKQQKEEVNL